LPIEAKGSAQQYTTDKEAFIPFSYGPANCAGKTLARIEMRYVLATLVRCFDFYHFRCEGAHLDVLKAKVKEWTDGLRDKFVFDKPGLDVEIISRRQSQGSN
jgi:hypothetical protein